MEMKFFRKFTSFLTILCLCLHSASAFAIESASTPVNHYTFVGGENKIADLFYNNNSYYQCKTKVLCPVIEGPGQRPKKFAIFLLDKQTGLVVPSFLQCFSNGTSLATMSEDIIPLVNEALNHSPCPLTQLPTSSSYVSERLITETMNVIDSYDDQGCPRDDRSCGQQIYELFEQDVKNTLNIFSSDSSDTTQMGCLGTILANVKEALVSTLMLVVRDIPQGIWNVGTSLWNYVMGVEGESSTAMLLASVMSEDMANALAGGDFAKFYDLLRKNFFEFLGNIREFYAELLGCTEWSGAPYDSECLKKTNWSCPTCESVVNFLCGLGGQIGAGFLLGGILGTAKATVTLTSMRRSIAGNPSAFGIAPQAIRELADSQAINSVRTQVQQAKYQAGRYIAPVTQYITTSVQEMKTLFTMGGNFRTFVAANPVTAPYHITFQMGQNRAFRALTQNPQVLPGFTNNSALVLARRYASGFHNIRDSFKGKLRDLHNIRGNRFNQSIYDDITRRYFGDMQRELSSMGIQASPIPGGLRLSKGGEVFDYTPNFKDRIVGAGSGMNFDDFSRMLTTGDNFLDTISNSTMIAPGPNFLADMMKKAEPAKNIFVVRGQAADGYTYLAHFTAQGANIEDTPRCDDLLYNMEVIKIHDVTRAVEEAQ